MEKKVTSPVVKGLILSLILIVLSILFFVTGLDQATWAKWASGIVMVAGVIWSCTSFGQQMDNRVTFGKVFGHGFIVSLIVTAFTVVFTIIMISVFPEVKEKALEVARTDMEKSGKLTDSQIDDQIEMVKRSFSIIAIIGILIIDLFIGVIASLIGAAVTKKAPVTPFDGTVNQA